MGNALRILNGKLVRGKVSNYMFYILYITPLCGKDINAGKSSAIHFLCRPLHDWNFSHEDGFYPLGWLEIVVPSRLGKAVCLYICWLRRCPAMKVTLVSILGRKRCHACLLRPVV